MTKSRARIPTFRTSSTIPSTIGVTDELRSRVQRGYILPGLQYGNQAKANSFAQFDSGLSAAKDFVGFLTSLKSTQVSSRTEDFSDLRVYTTTEWNLLNQKASEIANFRGVPVDAVIDFLIVLTVIDNLSDMKLVADATQVAGLYDSAVLLNPTEILLLTDLNRVAYMATAFAALTGAFKKYYRAVNLSDNLAKTSDSIFNVISSVIGGFGSNSSTAKVLLDSGSAATAPSPFYLEQITGTRVPMSVIAKNPQLHSPSYVGKTFFGEYPTNRVVTDINEVFPKKIAVFGEYSGGAGTPMFNYQNMGRFADGLPLKKIINNTLYNKTTLTSGSLEETTATTFASDVANLLNITSSTIVEMRRPDTNIPVMLAMAAVLADSTKSPFSSNIFKEGWYISSSISNDLQVSNPIFLDGFKAFT